MSKTLLHHTLTNNIFDIFVDFLIFIHFHFMKIHRLLSFADRIYFDKILVSEYKIVKDIKNAIFFFFRMGKSRGEIQRDYRERKKKQDPNYLEKERKRAAANRVPAALLSKKNN